MGRKTKKKVLLFAAETNYGVDAIAAEETTSAVLGREVTITPMAGDNTPLAYDDGTMGNKPELATEIYATVQFTCDMAGSGTANVAPAWAPLMAACLRAVTVGADNVSMPINEDAEDSLTFYFYYDGALHKLTGARGTFSLAAQAKQLPSLQFTFTGLFAPVVNGVMPATTFDAWQTPVPVGAQYSSCTLNGAAVRLIAFNYDQANQVVHQEYVGLEEVQITDYQPTASITIEAEGLDDFDPFALAQTNAEVPFEFLHGPAGNQFGWASGRVSLKRPTYGDQDGTLTYQIDLNVIGNTGTITTK
ncbi:hypothetical protein JYB87_12775 [Shewanella avicenniae]|uniref:Phage tail tube, TTP, lambda-like n=1 Tax=Shewanella avicenniae TaxID=2814294 RepID=A0ABX7QME4_9GAMM|nr:phage tail tube protein [Shewanella avicenniae]QSX32622.1 hypothetical protein JYB87_12775 [Shewanella avicenniae]